MVESESAIIIVSPRRARVRTCARCLVMTRPNRFRREKAHRSFHSVRFEAHGAPCVKKLLFLGIEILTQVLDPVLPYTEAEVAN